MLNPNIIHEVMYAHLMKDIQIRSKENWIEEGEKSTKYRVSQEKVYSSKFSRIQK